MAQIVFMALSEGADAKKHFASIKTPTYDLEVVVVPNYTSAVEVARELAKEGAKFIELCAGFGHEGTSMVQKAVPGTYVGVVRFDVHPGNNNQSGDSVYK